MPREEATTRTAGFTLFEVLLVLGMAALIAGTATVRAAELIASARLANGARAVAALLRQARGHALARNVTVRVTFDASRACTELRDGPDVLAIQPLPRGVTFAALPVRGRILFGALGTADNGTIELGAGTRRRQVIVNQRGRVRLP